MLTSIDLTNWSKQIELEITQNGFIYIDEINYFAPENKVRVQFIQHPESFSESKRVLTFFEIENYTEEIFEEFDEYDVESLIGLDEYNENQTVKYVIHTEIREMIFETKLKPQIEKFNEE